MEKSGAWYSCEGEKIGQGKANACVFLNENPDLKATLENAIRRQLLGQAEPEEVEATAPDAVEG